MRDEWVDCNNNDEQTQQGSHINFDFLSLLAKPKVIITSFLAKLLSFFCVFVGGFLLWLGGLVVQDYYKILEVDYDATEEEIRSNYIRLALVCIIIIIFI